MLVTDLIDDVQADGVVQLLGNALVFDDFLERVEPNVTLFFYVVDVVGVVFGLTQDWTDGAHDEGEEHDADELREHHVQILVGGIALDFAVPHRCQRHGDPVQSCDVQCCVVVVSEAGQVHPRVLPGPAQTHPSAGKSMHWKEKNDQEIVEILQVAHEFFR